MPDVQHITRTGHFLTTVAELTMLSPRMRRITLAAPEIAGQHHGDVAAQRSGRP